MVMRLWWKDARQFWPIAALLVVFGGVIQVLVLRYGGDEARRGSLVFLAFLWTSLYAFAVAAAAFAGERESGTLRLLDTFAVDRMRLWGAKTAFALVSTALLAVVMVAIAAISTVSLKVDQYSPIVVFAIAALILLEIVGWGMFFSALLKSALASAVLSILCVVIFTPMIRNDGMYTAANEVDRYPVRLAVALTTLVASALILTRGAPPARSSRASRMIERSFASEDAKPARPRFWRHALRSLVWETVRTGGKTWWGLAGFVLAYSVVCLFAWSGAAWSSMFLANLLAGLFAGVRVFNGENRARTRLFLAHHGVRPGVIWMVKLGIWLATVAIVLWLPAIIVAAVWQYIAPGSVARRQTDIIDLPLGIAAVLSGGFVAGQFCGMTIRRGITAVAAAIMLLIVFVIPIGMLSGVNMLSPLFVALIVLAFLFVTWAWSRDWLLDPPGAAKWVRLGALVTGVSAVWFAGYASERAWGVPRLIPASETFVTRYTAPALRTVPREENAADLYRQASAKLGVPGARVKDSSEAWKETQRVVREGWDPKAQYAIAWLHDHPEALALARQAAQKPDCQFTQLDRATVAVPFYDFGNIQYVGDLVVLSAREALSRNDLAAAWSDILTLFHIARHCSGPVPPVLEYSGLMIERAALRLAMQWAANPGQTTKSLSDALAAYQALPRPSIGEALAVEFLLVRNTLAKPRDEIVTEVDALYWGGRKDPDRNNPVHTLSINAMTTPWEVERARRQNELIASELIGYALNDPYDRPWTSDNPPNNIRGRRWHPRRLPSGPTATERVTPLLRLIGMGEQVLVSPIPMNDRNEVARRALRIILALRVYQTEHGGRLPARLVDPEKGPLVAGHDLVDPYSGIPFDYVRSHGQILSPLGEFDPIVAGDSKQSLVPTNDCMLLFSVGPDFLNNTASVNDTYDGEYGDIIFPIRDNVPPPSKPEGSATKKE